MSSAGPEQWAQGAYAHSSLRARDMSRGAGLLESSFAPGLEHRTCPVLDAAARTSCRYVQSSMPAEGMSPSADVQGTSVRNPRACSARCGAPALLKVVSGFQQIFPGFGLISQSGVRPTQHQACLAQNLRRCLFRNREDATKSGDRRCVVASQEIPVAPIQFEQNVIFLGAADDICGKFRPFDAAQRIRIRNIGGEPHGRGSLVELWPRRSRFRAGENVAAASS